MKNDAFLTGTGKREFSLIPSGKPALIFLLIFVFGAVVRILWLSNYSLHYDESIVFGLSSGSFYDIIEACRKNSSNPPLHLYLIKILSVFGSSDFNARVATALTNVVSIAFVYLFAKILFREELPAVFSSLFFAISFMQFRFSNELRPYTLSVLFACIILIVFELAYQNPAEKKWKYIFAVVSSAGFFAQYGLSTLVAGLNLIFFAAVVFAGRKRELKDWILSQIITAMVCVGCFFWIIRYQLHLRKYFANFYLAPFFPESKNLLSLLLFFLKQCYALIQYFLLGLGTFQSIVMLLLFISGIFYIFAERKLRLIAYIIIPFFITFLYACAGFYPFGPTRQCIFLSIPVYAVAGAGAAYLFKSRMETAVILLSIFLSLSFSVSAYVYSNHFIQSWKGRVPLYFLNQTRKYNFNRSENMKPAIDYLKANYADDEAIYVFRFAEPGFLRYYGFLENREVWNIFYRDKGWDSVNRVFMKKGLPIRFGIFSQNAGYILRDFEKAFGDKEKCWIVLDKFYDFSLEVISRIEKKNYILLKKYYSPESVSMVCLFEKNEKVLNQKS